MRELINCDDRADGLGFTLEEIGDALEVIHKKLLPDSLNPVAKVRDGKYLLPVAESITMEEVGILEAIITFLRWDVEFFRDLRE